MIKTLVLRFAILAMLLGAVFTIPAYAQSRELCFQGCIQKYQVALSFCALGNSSGLLSVVCHWQASTNEAICDAFCW